VFRRVLVANRGEIALRIIRACHAVGAQAVAIYSEADAHSPHLRSADEAICVGPAPAARSYLHAEAILQAALQTGCQAIHPGFGFLAENAIFAQRCRDAGLTFIGPSPRAIRRMGDKATARRTMQDAGLPVMPGSSGILPDVDSALQRARQVGFPVLLKATAGGGGKGMRRVDDEAGLAPAFEEAGREARQAFGNGDLYLEKYIVGARHIEFQVLADRWGRVLHLGERECSVQRNHQKLLEEAPAHGLDDAERQALGARICAAVASIGYEGAGTMEFLRDADGHFYFMEMNTRIQVEHPVTELITGVDLVAWQIRIAAGQPLSLRQEDIRLQGHALEVRINAEDPAQGFRPQPGTLQAFDIPHDGPAGPVRLDTHVETGYRIPPHYDSMIGKVIVHGPDRERCLARMREVLEQSRIVGVPTTLPLHLAILRDEAFRAGRYTCAFLAERPGLLAPPTP
jgi:acetyl-CoA carboxylase biotin carboxylase subunit